MDRGEYLKFRLFMRTSILMICNWFTASEPTTIWGPLIRQLLDVFRCHGQTVAFLKAIFELLVQDYEASSVLQDKNMMKDIVRSPLTEELARLDDKLKKGFFSPRGDESIRRQLKPVYVHLTTHMTKEVKNVFDNLTITRFVTPGNPLPIHVRLYNCLYCKAGPTTQERVRRWIKGRLSLILDSQIKKEGQTDLKDSLQANSTKLNTQREEVEANSAKLKAQGEEIEANSAKLKAQGEEIEANSTKLQAQVEDLKANSKKAEAQRLELSDMKKRKRELCEEIDDVEINLHIYKEKLSCLNQDIEKAYERRRHH